MLMALAANTVVTRHNIDRRIGILPSEANPRRVPLKDCIDY